MQPATAREYRLRADLIGTAWMPAVTMARPVDVRFRRVSRNATAMLRDEITELRDLLLRVTGDGDFRSCRLVNATVTVTDRKDGRTRSRTMPLTGRMDTWNADMYGSEDEAYAAADILDEFQA